MKKLICVIGAVLGSLTFSQVPEFSQQYAQRLGGAIDELAAIAADFDADAAASGLTREEGLARYENNPDAFLVDRGISMRQVFVRHARLSEQLTELREAGPVGRAVSMVRYFDTDVGAAALENYAPAIPITFEGMAHAAGGLLAGYGFFWTTITAVSFPFRRRRTRQGRHAR